MCLQIELTIERVYKVCQEEEEEEEDPSNQDGSDATNAVMGLASAKGCGDISRKTTARLCICTAGDAITKQRDGKR